MAQMGAIEIINPIVRSDGRPMELAATEDVAGTWIKRGTFVLMAAVLLGVTFRRRRPPARAAGPVIVTNRFRKRA